MILLMRRLKIKFFNITALLLVLTGLATNILHAQSKQLNLQGYFLADTIKIGETVAFSMSLEHPVDYELIFPDSNYNYAPFELVSKEYFTSKSTGNISKDSVVFYLSTFEIDNFLSFSLPVFIYQNKDSVELYSNIDTVYIKSVLPTTNAEVKLKENTNLQILLSQFNYPYLIVGLVIIVIILVLLLVVFGNKIRQRIKVYFLKRAYQQFVKDFSLQMEKYDRDKELSNVESLLKIWKQYLGLLSELKIDTFTSKEIFGLYNDTRLLQTLNNIDRAIYGGVVVPELRTYMYILEEKAKEQYIKKLETLK